MDTHPIHFKCVILGAFDIYIFKNCNRFQFTLFRESKYEDFQRDAICMSLSLK